LLGRILPASAVPAVVRLVDRRHRSGRSRAIRETRKENGGGDSEEEGTRWSENAGGPRLYTLEVFLLSGPITKAFAKKHPVVSRTIQLRGDQTLADLHRVLFDAFDRDDEHRYEFQFGKGPMDPHGRRYVLPGVAPGGQATGAGGDPGQRARHKTTLGEADLPVGTQVFRVSR
jgi:hypothetical protein